MIDFLVYALSGKLLLFLSKRFPPVKTILYKKEFFAELYDCNLCYGFWVYLFLSFFFKNINVEQIKNKYVGQIVVAGFTTFIIHLISIGWDEIFGKVVIDAYGEQS